MTRPQKRRVLGLLLFLVVAATIAMVRPEMLDNPLVGVAMGVFAAIVAMSLIRVKSAEEVAGELHRELMDLPPEQLADIVRKALTDTKAEEKVPEAEREKRYSQKIKELENEIQKRR